ncbi:MAG TPA: hypothetical protein VI685_15645, partial [Candidatus Angelobacter sp.]
VDEDTANVYRQLFELRLERVRAVLDDTGGDGNGGEVPQAGGIRRELVRAQRAKLPGIWPFFMEMHWARLEFRF